MAGDSRDQRVTAGRRAGAGGDTARAAAEQRSWRSNQAARRARNRPASRPESPSAVRTSRLRVRERAATRDVR